MYQTDPPRPAKEVLPTMYDLKSEDPEESGLPDEFHDLQPQLLRETFRPVGYSPQQVFLGTDLNVYYDVRHSQWYKRPDWFAVLGVSRLYEQRDLRLSYVIWQEGVSPFVVVELVSPGTEKEDLGQTLRDADAPPTKWEVYEQILRVPYYLVFNRYNNELRAFELRGSRYQEIALRDNRLWLSEIELGIGLWSGTYQNINRQWLRWCNLDNEWLLTPEEQEAQRAEQEYHRAEQERERAEREAQRAEQERDRAEREAQRAEQEYHRAEQERDRAERLARKLQELGIDPDEDADFSPS